MCMKFRTFWKKRWISQPNLFRNYGLGKRLLLERLKGLASEDTAVINVLRGYKHCWNLHGTTILLFLHDFGIYWVGKCLRESDLKSWDCLLTRWLPISSIPVAMCTISGNKFKRHYLKKKRLFLIFYCIFESYLKSRTFRKRRWLS